MTNSSNKESPRIIHEDFLFKEGFWKGIGTVIIQQTGATLHFVMSKKLEVKKNGDIVINQEIDLPEIEESWKSNFDITDIEDDSFAVSIKSKNIGSVEGDGILTATDITWKLYDDKEKLLGTTHFMRLDDGNYLMNSAYQVYGKSQVSISGVISMDPPNQIKATE